MLLYYLPWMPDVGAGSDITSEWSKVRKAKTGKTGIALLLSHATLPIKLKLVYCPFETHAAWIEANECSLYGLFIQ